MAEKLTLVVTCTDRKSARPADHLRFGHLPASPLPDRARQWRSALLREKDRVPLRKLYQGDAWAQALRLETATRQAGFDPTLLVVSAGLGLVRADEEWPAYAATFSSQHSDSIGTSRADNRQWWRLITDTQETFDEQVKGQTLLVLSETYANALADHLSQLHARDDVVIFGGSAIVPQHLRVPADHGLRAALGGTSGSLNVRTAAAWVNSLPAPTVRGNREHEEWTRWVQATRKPQSYNRVQMSDPDILNFLRDIRRRCPDISKSRALRMFRDAGLACEQQRFSELFSAVVRETT